ncbi:MAG: Mrp/NBP35 family ATP-binding protein [Ilumatobacteraceae bacterium]|nr:Mrp/NBP35 family ATP-binding protein [Ilumatobacteraceae bacterium]
MSKRAVAAPSIEEVQNLLRAVIDPELGDNIVDLGMAGAITMADGVVTIGVKLTIRGCPLRAQIQKDIRSRLEVHPWVTKVKIDWGEMTPEERTDVMSRARWNARENATDTAVPLSARVLAIASGKGGVGKSSVTVNLAAALAAAGKTVGVLDADIWGFSIPRMLGMPDRLEAAAVPGHDKPMIIPNERVIGNGLLKVVSTGMLVEDEGTALMWRGLMLTKAVEQFLNDVNWGHLDYLLIDMPPGTGDVQMGLARMLPRTDLLIVTTPAVSAQKVAIRAADMARRSFLRVAGVIENMSEFTCDHGKSYALFGTGGGQALADEVGVELLGQIPIEPAVAAGGDNGEPLVLTSSSEAARVFSAIAARIIADTPEVEDMAGCSARDEDVVVTVRRSQNLQA